MRTNDLVEKLRFKLQDDKPRIVAFNVSAKGQARSVTIESTKSALIITAEGSQTVDSARLSYATHPTVGAMMRAISALRGLAVTSQVDTNASDHPSFDLHVDGISDITAGKAAAVRHRLWADEELLGFLQDAINSHNPNYTIGNVPLNEQTLVLLKAQVDALRHVAADAARRKGLEASVDDLLKLASARQSEYDAALRRMGKAVAIPKVDETKIGSGDFVNGKLFRQSLRSGYNASMRSALPLQPPVLFEPENRDVEDVRVRLAFGVSRDEQFVRFELWRDTQPAVERSPAGMRQDVSGLPAAYLTSRAGTAVSVAGGPVVSTGTLPAEGFGLFSERTSPLDRTVVLDGLASGTAPPLEPGVTYYYRLFAMDRNGGSLGSNVVAVTTRDRVARFRRADGKLISTLIDPSCLSANSGPAAGGDTVTLYGTGFLEGDTELLLGPYALPVTVVSPTELTFVTPTIRNPEAVGRTYDLVLRSCGGNIPDLLQNFWRVT